eukprot:11135188-Karenia_brevis.AAC.1
MNNAQIQSRVGRRLGIAISEERPCPFCFGIMDKWGIHPESCTAGGDKTAGHNDIRNGLYTSSKRAGAAPILEAKGILNTLRVPQDRGGQGDRRRPADVLLCKGCDIDTG